MQALGEWLEGEEEYKCSSLVLSYYSRRKWYEECPDGDVSWTI